LRFRSVLSVVCVVLGLLAWAPHVRADPQQQLDLATSRFENGRYDEAADMLGALLATAATPDTAEGRARLAVHLKARPIYAACLIALDRSEEADDVIIGQYRADPFYELPPGQFPQPVTDRFIEVSARHRDQIERWRQAVIKSKQQEAAERAAVDRARRERLATLERMAAEGRFTTTRSRFLAMVPFGLGQFQNDDVGLGVFFAAGQTVTIGAAVTSFFIAEDVRDTECPDVVIRESEGTEVTDKVDCDALRERFNIARAVNWVSFGSAIALIVGGIIEAQVSFVDEETEVRKRPIPPPVQVSPRVSVSTHGDVTLGLELTF